MILALSSYLDAHWTAVWVITAATAIAVVIVAGVIARRRGSVRVVLVGVLVALVLALGIPELWMYFGWETLYPDTGGAIRYHRTWGRVTVVTLDRDGDWLADAKSTYTWERPWAEGRKALHEYVVTKEDRNFDGQWDTWWTPVDGPEGDHPYVALEADVDLDGEPDYRSVEPADLGSWNYEKVAAKRGF